MDHNRRREMGLCRWATTLVLVHCICATSAWPADQGYSKVIAHSPASSNGAQVMPDVSRVHQARELGDLHPIWFPRTFNLTTTPVKASDRSDSSRENKPRIVYSVSQKANDRYSPADYNQYSQDDIYRDKENEPYIAPPGLNSFPPNSQSDYNHPSSDSSYLPPASGPVEPTIRPSSQPDPSISSYLPAASGPVGPAVRPISNDQPDPSISSYLPAASGPVQPSPHTSYGPPNSHIAYNNPVSDEKPDSASSYLPPASGPVEPMARPSPVLTHTNYGPPPIVNEMRPFKPPSTAPFPRPVQPLLPYPPPPPPSPPHVHAPSAPEHDYPMDYSHHHDEHPYPPHHDDSSSEYLDHPPPDYHEDPSPPHGKHAAHSFDPPSGPSFDHDAHHHHAIGDHGVDVYPEVIIDHFPDHHHHDDIDDDYAAFHHDHPDLPYPHPPPPPPPPPPPIAEVIVPETPRVKKYSYFYLGRKLWYVPLYFTVWFTFYVAYLIIQSIGRHKVDLPNHTKVRRSARDVTHKATVDTVDGLTLFVMQQISGFKEKQF